MPTTWDLLLPINSLSSEQLPNKRSHLVPSFTVVINQTAESCDFWMTSDGKSSPKLKEAKDSRDFITVFVDYELTCLPVCVPIEITEGPRSLARSQLRS